MCIHDLFHILLYLCHTNGSVECTCACMYVNIYVLEYMYSQLVHPLMHNVTKRFRWIQGTGESDAPPPPSNNCLVYNYKSKYLQLVLCAKSSFT